MTNTHRAGSNNTKAVHIVHANKCFFLNGIVSKTYNGLDGHSVLCRDVEKVAFRTFDVHETNTQ